MAVSLAANPPISDQTIWIVVGTAGLVVMYLLMRPKKKDDARPRVPSFPLHRQRDVEEQMSNLLVELSNMARQITAQLDTRAAKLELLIREADEKIAALHRAGQAPTYADVRPAPDPAPDDDAPAIEPIIDPPAAPGAPTTRPATDSRHADIYSLANEGRSAQEIARLLSRPTGEIELILALRPR